SEYFAIYDAIVKKNKKYYDEGGIDGAAAHYGENGVVIDRKNNICYFGSEQIKQMIADWLRMGKMEFKLTRKEITDLGNDRFYADVDIESVIVESGKVMRATSQSLFQKTGDNWTCVYEGFEIQ
ncbi:hypothetical protein PMAYCL1PPCAC_22187, partial [Pristionchus mayeri]